MIGHFFGWVRKQIARSAILKCGVSRGKPDISSVQETALLGILYEFCGVFILAKTRCLELATNNLLT